MATPHPSEPHPAPPAAEVDTRVEAALAATATQLRALVSERLAPHSWARSHPTGIDALTGGKYVRARAFLTTAYAYGATDSDAMTAAAAALELVHTASLVHDDIIDSAELRRGYPALHIATNEATAILVGDLLFALAFELTAPLGTPVTTALARAYTGLCEGQLVEPDLTWDSGSRELLERYGSLKTGALFGAAYELGGVVADRAEDECTALRAAGVGLGLAFQLADDLLDVHGDAAELGKDHGADLRNGVPSLPLWLAYQELTSGSETQERVPVEALAATAGSQRVSVLVEQRIAELADAARATMPRTADPALREAAILAVVAAGTATPGHPTPIPAASPSSTLPAAQAGSRTTGNETR